MAEQKTNVIDISKFFGGKTMSSADVRVNTSTVLKTEPSFIAAPELARLLDVIAVSTEESKTQVEQIKSIERVREREIITREKTDSRFQQALSSLMSDVAGLKNVYMGLIKTLEGDRKLKEEELRDRQNKEKILASEQSEVQKGMQFQASMAKPTKSFMGLSESEIIQKQTDEEDDRKGNIADTLLGAAGLSVVGGGIVGGILSGGDEFGEGNPGTGGKLKPVHKQALDIISGPESGGDYNAMNNGKAGDRPGGSKKWLGKDLTEMTIGEVKNHQTVKKTLWAAGRYQFVPNTLPGVAASAGLKDSDMFDKNNQDLMAITLVKQRGIQPWTVGGSKYSKEELAIVEKARTTPLETPETSQVNAKPASKPTSSTPQASTSTSTTPPPATSQAKPTSSNQQVSSAIAPMSGFETTSGQQIASTITPESQAGESKMGASNEPTRMLTPDLTAMVETKEPDKKITPDKITPSDAGMESGNIQIAMLQTPVQQRSSSGVSLANDAPDQGLKTFSPINPENLFMLHTARELNIA